MNAPVKLRFFAPPSVLPDISPTRGEISHVTLTTSFSTLGIGPELYDSVISPRVGEMSGRTEGGVKDHDANLRAAP